MKIIQSYLKNNPCYQCGQYITVKGLMLHSVGCPQPSGKVWCNVYANNSGACVHAFIDANDGTVYQTLPWNMRGWHGGGSSNDTHIGVEMAESSYINYTNGASFTCSNIKSARKQAETAYNAAVELFAMLCDKFSLNPLTQIVSHSEGYRKGIATNHSDPEHYWKGLGLSYTMDGFRRDVNAKMGKSDGGNQTVTATTGEIYRVRKSANNSKSQIGAWHNLSSAKAQADKNKGYSVFDDNGNEVYTPKSDTSFKVRVTATDLNIRKGAGLSYAVVGTIKPSVYTIVQTKSADGYVWGKLKSGAGWVALKYTTRV